MFELTEVEFRPVKKIVILEDIKYETLEDFLTTMVTGVSPTVPITVLWAEGVVFSHSALPLSDVTVKDRLKGVVYWNCIHYAKMDEYEKEKKIGIHTVRIIKVTAPALIDAAKALKKKLTSKR